MISEGGLSGLERGPGVGQTRPPSFHGPRNNMMVHQDDLDEDTESAITSVSQDLALKSILISGRNKYRK